MNKFIILAAAAIMMVACTKQQQTKSVTFYPQGDLTFESLDKSPQVTDLWLFDGEELIAHTNGQPAQVELAYGQHTIHAAASDGTDPFVYQNNIMFCDVSGNTFQGSTTVNIRQNTKDAIEISMSRIATKFRFTFTDAIPEGTDRVLVFHNEWWYGFNVTDGYAYYEDQEAEQFEVSPDMWGVRDVTFEFCGFIPEDCWAQTLTIRAMKGTRVVGEVTLHNVPFWRNTVTHYSGAIGNNPTGNADWTLNYDEEWNEPWTYNW